MTEAGAGRSSGSLWFSTRHRVITRLRLARMAPRRARALRELRSRAPIPRVAPGPERVLVIAHVYYPELWPELAERIRLIPGDVDVVVTLVAGRADSLVGPIHGEFPGADIRVLENRGRDIWPFLQVLDRVPGHDVVLKVHTKRSPHMRRGDAWRSELLDGIAASPQQVAAIVALLRTDARAGMIAPPRNVLGREFIANNADLLADLMRRGSRTCDSRDLWFPAGSMFWSRPEVLLPLQDLNLGPQDFGEETGAIDGTLPHALERYLGVVAASESLAVVESSEVDGLLAGRAV